MDVPPILTRRRFGLFARLVGNGFVQAVATVATVLLVDRLFDDFISARGRRAGGLVWMGLGLISTACVAALLRMYERTDAERLGQDYAFDVRLTLSERLMSLAPRALQSRSRGGVMLRFVGDLTSLRQWVSLGLARLAVGSITTVTGVVALSYLNLALGVTVGGVLAVGTVAAVSLGGRLRAASQEARRRRGRLAANINEKVASIAVVQLFDQRDRESRRIARQSQLLQDAMIRQAKVGGQLRAVTEGTAAVATAAALLVGVSQVATGRAGPGTVAAAVTIVGFLHRPLRELSRVQEYRQKARVSVRKIQAFLDIPSLVEEKEGAPDLIPGPGRLVLDSVTVSGALLGVDVTAEAGTRVAVVGPNGAGKSTLLALAARLIDPDEGAVRLDGQDLREHTLASVRRAVGMVSPDLPLLRGTVAKNLRYRWPKAPEEELARVRALCKIDDVLAESVDGGPIKVSEGGLGLSTGQRQRIALARALLGSPPLLLLDEVDSHLDAQASEIVLGVLAGYPGTVLLVSHRPEMLRAVDTIWRLDGGRMVEERPTKRPAARRTLKGSRPPIRRSSAR